jgi:O6-methylguanine-DNA--protein-cysteine methyltransferase
MFCYAATGDGMVWSGFARSEATARREVERRFGPISQRAKLLRTAERQIRAYFKRELRAFDLPLVLEGTALQLDAWRLGQRPNGGRSYPTRTLRAPSGARGRTAASRLRWGAVRSLYSSPRTA